MKNSPSAVNILKSKIEEHIETKKLERLLLNGKFYDFEEQVFETLMNVYDKVCEALITCVSNSRVFENKQRELAKSVDLKKLKKRQTQLQLRTGTKIRFESFYAKKAPKDYKGNRNLGLMYFNCDKNSGLMYQSIMCLLSVVCPSTEVSKKICKHLGIKTNYNRIRTLSLSLATNCMKDRSVNQLKKDENLSGKNVVIEIDGGRIRSRVYKDEKGPKRDQKFETPWREPKLFVITTLDKEGKLNKQDLPIYDTSFGDDETFDLLEVYLKRLKIEEAKSVQFIADGAPWIWNRARPMLEKLGVQPDKIIETLDYYHAAEHLAELMEYVEKKDKALITKKIKDALWNGKIKKIEKLVKQGIPGVDLNKFNPYKYFVKNSKRIDYQTLKNNKKPVGSGVVESGIRRVINLRFKSPSAFWYPENVEKLIYMRGVMLSGRWNIMINNLKN